MRWPCLHSAWVDVAYHCAEKNTDEVSQGEQDRSLSQVEKNTDTVSRRELWGCLLRGWIITSVCRDEHGTMWRRVENNLLSRPILPCLHSNYRLKLNCLNVTIPVVAAAIAQYQRWTNSCCDWLIDLRWIGRRSFENGIMKYRRMMRWAMNNRQNDLRNENSTGVPT